MALAALVLSGCATPYAQSGLTGGYTDNETAPGVWSVTFSGNGYTTAETVQAYWLYHAADLALSKGYQGFQVTSQIELAEAQPATSEAGIIRVKGGGGGGGGARGGGSRTYVYTYGYYSTAQIYKPAMQANIKLLKAPLAGVPEQKVFNASTLKTQLEPYVNGLKCSNNVCPHLHLYLYSPLPTAGAPTT